MAYDSLRRRNALELSSGIEDLGGIKWDLCVFLLVSWLLIFACLFKGKNIAQGFAQFTPLCLFFSFVPIFVAIFFLCIHPYLSLSTSRQKIIIRKFVNCVTDVIHSSVSCYVIDVLVASANRKQADVIDRLCDV